MNYKRLPFCINKSRDNYILIEKGNSISRKVEKSLLNYKIICTSAWKWTTINENVGSRAVQFGRSQNSVNIKASRDTIPIATYGNNLNTSPSSGSFGHFNNKPLLNPLNRYVII